MDTGSLGTLDKSELIALIVALSEQNTALAARVATLEAKLNIAPKTPDNSSLPPSTGQKANRPETVKTPRKGRPGVSRTLEPDPDHVREVYAKACNGCGTRLLAPTLASFRARWTMTRRRTGRAGPTP